jgi:hypothetical protein
MSDPISTLVHAPSGHVPFMIESFLRRYPDIAAAIEAAGAFVVVSSPPLEAEDFDESPSLPRFLERVAHALEEAERALPARPGWPLHVCYASGSVLPRGPGIWALGEVTSLVPRPARGAFAGFVIGGEGGAIYFTPSGQEGGGWEGARALVLAELHRLFAQPRGPSGTVGSSRP